MGLDMYLTARQSLGNTGDGEKRRKAIQEIFKGTVVEVFEPESVTFEVMYWRKANAIHQWFVTNVQEGTDDCGYYDVSLEQLMTLRDIIKNILADRNADKAQELLPPASGFFFGSVDIGDYYWEYLKDTEECLDKIAKRTMYDNLKGTDYWISFIYHSSW